jgi:hypothetical protein
VLKVPVASREDLYRQIGLQQKLFSVAQLEAAGRQAAGSGGSVGEGLVANGALSQDQHRGLERAVTYRLGRDEDKRIAKIIVESGYAQEHSVEAALKRQKEFYGQTGELIRLGTVLVEQGEISDSQGVAARKIYDIEKGRFGSQSRDTFGSSMR